MGSLTPGTAYTYESVDGTTVATNVETGEKVVVGYEYDPFYKELASSYFVETFWKDVLKEAETNLPLREAIERVKIIYYLGKNRGA
jgi:hypothetical protein